jgi:RNA polymerase sigma-70 factor (ECF subfamily)
MDSQEASRLVSELFESDYSTFVRYCLRATRNFEVAEDLVQEAFMLLYREVRSGTQVDNPKAWTFCVIRRLISKQIRTWSKTALIEPLSVLDDFPVNLKSTAPSEFGSDDVTKLFSVLTRREEEVTLLRMAALKYREIADRLGISPKTVNTLLARALRKMQKAVGTEPQRSSRPKHAGPISKTLQ